EGAVALRARAGREAGAVQLAEEGRATLGRREAERGARRGGRIARVGSDRRVGRGRVDRPRVGGGGGVGVSGSVRRVDLEGVVSLCEPGVGLGGGAGREAGAVQLALEARAALGRGEADRWI